MRLIKGRDLVDLLAIATLLVLAGIVPERHWGRLCLGFARVHVRLFGFHGDHLGRLPDQIVGIGARDIEVEFRRHSYWELLELLRGYWPGGWTPKTTLIGEEHIRTALARGKGVIFWNCTFARSTVPFNQVTRSAGYPISALANGTHGFSDTKFGVRFLNPIKISMERRYAWEYCFMGPEGAGPAIRRLIGRLRENGCVYIAAIQTGKHVSEQLCLGGRIRIAKGGPSIAVTTGAALLPTFTVPDGPSSFATYVEPPLVSNANDDERKQEEMVSAYIPILERYVRRWPHLWRGWIGSRNYWQPG